MNSQGQMSGVRPRGRRLVHGLLVLALMGLTSCSTTSSSNSPIRWPWKRERTVPPAPAGYGNNRAPAATGADPFLPSPTRPAADQQPAPAGRENASLSAPIPVDSTRPS